MVRWLSVILVSFILKVACSGLLLQPHYQKTAERNVLQIPDWQTTDNNIAFPKNVFWMREPPSPDHVLYMHCYETKDTKNYGHIHARAY